MHRQQEAELPPPPLVLVIQAAFALAMDLDMAAPPDSPLLEVDDGLGGMRA